MSTSPRGFKGFPSTASGCDSLRQLRDALTFDSHSYAGAAYDRHWELFFRHNEILLPAAAAGGLQPHNLPLNASYCITVPFSFLRFSRTLSLLIFTQILAPVNVEKLFLTDKTKMIV